MFRLGASAAAVVPGPVASSLSTAVGAAVGRLPDFDGRRAVVASHMARVLGRALEPGERRRLVAAVFASYARYWADSFRLPHVTAERVVAEVTVIGGEHLETAREAGRGCVIAAPHLGGWEWGARYLLARGLSVTVAVEPLAPDDVFQWFVGFRERLGMQVVPLGEGAGATLLRALKNNRALCLLSDRLVAQASGTEVEFFGGRLKMPAGPVTLALRSGAGLIAGAVYQEEGPDAHTIVFRPPLVLEDKGRFRESVNAGAQALAAELEELVRRAPTQWHLLQPNWPDDPQLHSPWGRRRHRGVARAPQPEGAVVP